MIVYYEMDMENEKRNRFVVIKISENDWDLETLYVDITQYDEDWLDNYYAYEMASHVQIEELTNDPENDTKLGLNMKKINRRLEGNGHQVRELRILVGDIQEILHTHRIFD